MWNEEGKEGNLKLVWNYGKICLIRPAGIKLRSDWTENVH